MSLYYEDEFVQLHHGDCRAVRGWTQASVLITDPPYGTAGDVKRGADGYGRRVGNHRGLERAHDGQAIANDETADTRDMILALWGDKPALVFGSPRMPDPPMKVADRLVWDKKRPGMNGGPWRYRHETIYVTEGFVRTNDAAVSILTAFPEQDDHIHGKPLALMEALVGAAPPGLIADPFAGSGTTLVAARNLGRKIIGVELVERYCEIIVRRLSQQAFDFSALDVSA